MNIVKARYSKLRKVKRKRGNGENSSNDSLLESHSECAKLLYDEVVYFDSKGLTALMIAEQVENEDAASKTI